MDIELFPMSLAGNDSLAVVACIKQGIDSRLEGFTRSTFHWVFDTGRLNCLVYPDEMPILIRRLVDLNPSDLLEVPGVTTKNEDDILDEASGLADILVEMFYGVDMGYGTLEA